LGKRSRRAVRDELKNSSTLFSYAGLVMTTGASPSLWADESGPWRLVDRLFPGLARSCQRRRFTWGGFAHVRNKFLNRRVSSGYWRGESHVYLVRIESSANRHRSSRHKRDSIPNIDETRRLCLVPGVPQYRPTRKRRRPVCVEETGVSSRLEIFCWLRCFAGLICAHLAMPYT